ncbi:hypothetical protein [Chryseobacterium gleum]|uniref:hypothetical protein n=1 Tax=Chryseobacterium gleum TaxID=250 RepID=UPI0031CF5952
MKPEKIKIKRAGRRMMDAGSSYLSAKDYTSFHKKILWKNIDSFGFNNFSFPASDFLTLLAELG